MLKDLSSIARTSLMAAALVATGQVLHADTKPNVPPGYKLIEVKGGDHPSYVLVKDATDPFKNVSSTGSSKYDPGQLLNHSSSMANKSFLSGSPSDSSSTFLKHDSNYSAKTYAFQPASLTNHAMPNLDAKVQTPTSTYAHGVAGYDKSYAGLSSNDVGTKTAILSATSTTSSYQGRAATAATYKPGESNSASTLGSKQYLGPGGQHLPEGVNSNDSYKITRMSGVPDRDLSIDEVRNLINNDAKPNTDVPPEAPSKPLNDPDYKPEPSPAPPATSSDDAKYDPIPAPGTMATPQPPENAEPLPQH